DRTVRVSIVVASTNVEGRGPRAEQHERAARGTVRGPRQEPARRARSPGEGGRPSGEGEGKMWDWLLSLDKGKGGLLQYFPRIQMEFDCEFAQIAASRLPQPVSDGVLGMVQPQLFEAATPLVTLASSSSSSCSS
ncbi:unnamed protein product, partial [Prorocentrum cordatum]